MKLYIALLQVLFITASWMDLDFPVLKPESYRFPAAVATLERFHINFNVSEVDLQIALNEVYFPGVQQEFDSIFAELLSKQNDPQLSKKYACCLRTF